METLRIINYYTRSEAQKAVKNAKAGTSFYLHVRIELPVDVDDNTWYNGYGSVKLSRKEAQKFVENLLSPTLEEKGARIKVSQTLDTFWIG
jgi:hypothetical protein